MQQGRHLGGLKFHDAKMTPARRSWSLEGNLDIANHVIIRDEDKGKAQYSSHLHGLDVNESNQQRGSVRFSATASHILGRRLQIIATPTSASSTPPATSSSPTVNDIIKTDVDIQVPHNQPKQQCAYSSEVVTKEARGEEEDAGIPSQQIPSKTNYPDPKTDNNAFRERTDTANSAIFDISYDL